jgi:hypothetical protein
MTASLNPEPASLGILLIGSMMLMGRSGSSRPTAV